MNCKFIFFTLSACLVGCDSDSSNEQEYVRAGEWLTGDIHVHSTISADARDTSVDILHHAFDKFNLDYVFFANHMRNDSQDNQDNNIGGKLYHEAMRDYEQPELQYLGGTLYPDKIIASTFEWDMPGHEHYNIGLIGLTQKEQLEATKLFEYQFSYKNRIDQFDSQDLQAWDEAGIVRHNGMNADKHHDAIKAMMWLQEHYPTSGYGLLNHPLRYENSYTIAQIRDLNNAAPDVFFLVEGMVGGQFNNNRGDYSITGGSAGVYGGVDPVVATVGGWWDALLSEGRHIWNVANSDHHIQNKGTLYQQFLPR